MRTLLILLFGSIVVDSAGQVSTNTAVTPNVVYVTNTTHNFAVGSTTSLHKLFVKNLGTASANNTFYFEASDANFYFDRYILSLKAKSTSANTPSLEWWNAAAKRQAYLGGDAGFFNLKLENNMNFGIMGGNVGIGVSDTRGFKLAVDGKIIVEEVTVQMSENWPDFVFENSYKLPKLSEVERYILLNKHLPGIPSAVDVHKNGIEIGQMQSQLLQKIEELTVYLIELEKKVESLQTETNKRTKQHQ